jgi:hypothetical protein
MPELSPPPSINDLRAQGIYAIIARYGALDLTPLLLYTIGNAPKSALKWLAWQFDVLDPEWQLLAGPAGESTDVITDPDEMTDTDTLDSPDSELGPSDWDSWRYLIRVAVPLHSKVGTPAMIKQVFAALGWSNVTLLEGQNSWGGNSWPVNEGWAVCRILINLSATDRVAAADVANIVSAFNFFKPARVLLDSIWLYAPPIGDAAPKPRDFTGLVDFIAAVRDVISAPFPPIVDVRAPIAYCNGHYYCGTQNVCAPAQPVVVDSGITIAGVPISAKG